MTNKNPERQDLPAVDDLVWELGRATPGVTDFSIRARRPGAAGAGPAWLTTRSTYSKRSYIPWLIRW
ncbi:hypothetical protein H7J50_27790 [Mycobacterium intermedium]|uniref:hypothetical protein n=1 Tax=Mycobacterium intermedium TaxID=28445 RepID=UPI00111C13FF|nr:hypothetical protein [Mycobacterium intermedium]MCV6967576.1 hypothetical protein [Mycobacterium intermedium]